MRGRSATLHSGGGEATPYCGGGAFPDADPYATFPYADPRKQRAEPSTLELALAKIMRGYLRASSDDLSSLSQTSLDSEPLRVRVHVKDSEAQTERPSVRNACVSTTALPSPSSRRLLMSLEPPTLSKARSLSSLSHWPEEVGCERCASPSPPRCLSPCGSPPTRRSHVRPGSSNLVDWGRSLSLSQFLSALTAEQRQELEAEESEDAEEFLKQLLARQQREREDLENRHRRELELVRQRLRNAGPSVWPLCEATSNGGSPPQRAVPHSQSVPHFPRGQPSDWHPPPPTEPLRINLHRSTSEGPEPNALGRPLHRTRTLTDDLLRLVQLNGAARTCPGPASPEGKPTLHQLMQQRSLREGATSPASPLTPPSSVFAPLTPPPSIFPPLTLPPAVSPPHAVYPPSAPGYPSGYPPPSGCSSHLHFGSAGRGTHRHQ